mmetsp:Transcript_10054/g.22888  ORF Transcript_10054/g.22888 Transcript_10054/m.22888 type:complete len:215 (+) Transcript_10054:333-977(+)
MVPLLAWAKAFQMVVLPLALHCRRQALRRLRSPGLLLGATSPHRAANPASGSHPLDVDGHRCFRQVLKPVAINNGVPNVPAQDALDDVQACQGERGVGRCPCLPPVAVARRVRHWPRHRRHAEARHEHLSKYSGVWQFVREFRTTWEGLRAVRCCTSSRAFGHTRLSPSRSSGTPFASRTSCRCHRLSACTTPSWCWSWRAATQRSAWSGSMTA